MAKTTPPPQKQKPSERIDFAFQGPVIPKLTEEQTRQYHQAKLTALGQMAGCIAHEINNPLSVIRMNAEMLTDYARQGDNVDKVIAKAQKIIDTADRISAIIRALKSMSSSSSVPQFEHINLSQMVDDIYDLCEPHFKMNDITVTIKKDVIKDKAFLMDAAQISQALINLLNNSADAIRETSNKWIAIDVSMDEHNLVIMVTDSGHGIPADVLDKILQPFYSTKSSHSGLGIGLNLVQAYTAFHNGKLKYMLLNGHTTFVMEFPLSRVLSDKT